MNIADKFKTMIKLSGPIALGLSACLCPQQIAGQESIQSQQLLNSNFSVPNAATSSSAINRPPAPKVFAPKESSFRTAQNILDAGDIVCRSLESSVVQVLDKDSKVALGTVVSKQGHVLTKLSLVRGLAPKQVRFRVDGHTWSGSMVGFDSTDDLALYRLHSGDLPAAKTLKAITLTNQPKLRNGKIVIGVGTESKALQIGMTTAAPSEKALAQDCETCIDLGLSVNANMVVTRVYPRTVGERLGMLVGDKLISIDRKKIRTPKRLADVEKLLHAGDLISIEVKRNDRPEIISGKVPPLTSISKRDRWGGGPFSQRRSGFSDVLVHDSVVDPSDCGGPLVNLSGEFCGINIARSMRVASLAIPTRSIREFLNRYLDDDILRLAN